MLTRADRVWDTKRSRPVMAMSRRELLAFLGGAALLSAAPKFEKGAIIRTILKDMTPESLGGGAVLFHEHMSLAADFMPRWMSYLRAARSGTPATPPPPSTEPYFMQDLDLMTSEMRAAAADGASCIVDGGHPDMGRSLDFLKQLSTKSGLPIVASCGYYAQPFYPPEIAQWSEDQIAQELIRQATTEPVGAIGEIGTWAEMTADERKVFRAVSKAHLKTNLPVFTHTDFGKGAEAQLDIFESMGVNPRRVVIGHLGGLVDADAKVQIAIGKRGAYVGFDRLGGPSDPPQVGMIQKMIDAGLADRIMLASDFSNARQLKKNGGPGYGKTLTMFVPLLKKAGIPEDVLHGIVYDNPRQFLAFVPRTKRAEA